MLDNASRSSSRRVRVQVGHAEVQVRCRSHGEAIRLAREQLRLEMPRLWDVIDQLDDSRFQVEPLDGG